MAEGARPALLIRDPRAATIAPLSVHKIGDGIRRRIPASVHRCSASWRNREFAATPPAITNDSMPVVLHAANDFCKSTSTIAS